MTAKPVQVSIDTELLARIDRDPEARRRGRSAFVRTAVETYLQIKERRQVEERLQAAYGGRAGELRGEVEDLLGVQAWPEE